MISQFRLEGAPRWGNGVFKRNITREFSRSQTREISIHDITQISLVLGGSGKFSSFLLDSNGLMMPKLRIIARDLLYSGLEVAYPHTIVVLGGESFRVPLRWRHWFCEGYEQPTFDFIHTYCTPGTTLIDIGAHFGIFTISALRRVGPAGKVISFEPCAATRSILLRTLELNGFSGIPEIRDEAVSNVTGQSLFFSSTIPGDAANSLIGNAEHLMVSAIRTVRLDDIHLSRVDAIKIDAEGAELQILDGSRALIMKHRPAVLLSIHPIQIKRSGKSLGELWDAIESMKFIPHLNKERVSAEWFCGQTELFDICLKARP